MPHIGDPGIVGRLDVISPFIFPFSPRHRKKIRECGNNVLAHFLLALDLGALINHVKIIKNKKFKKESNTLGELG